MPSKCKQAHTFCTCLRHWDLCVYRVIIIFIYLYRYSHSKCIFIIRYNNYDRALAHAIETQVINWTNLIQKTLKEDSSDLLLTGCNPGPDAELKFWASRQSNILSIYHQVCSPFLLIFCKIIIWLVSICSLLKCVVLFLVAPEPNCSEDGKGVRDPGQQLLSSNQDSNWKCIWW